MPENDEAPPPWVQPLINAILGANKTKTNSLYKLQPLSETDTDSWLTWKKSFLLAQKGNAWSNAQARRALISHMQGQAQKLTQDLPANDDNVDGGTDAADFKLLLDTFHERFMSNMGTRNAAERFYACKQDGRPIKIYANELRLLFLLMQPDATDRIQTEQPLQNALLRQLDSSEVAARAKTAWIAIPKAEKTFDNLVAVVEQGNTIESEKKLQGTNIGSASTDPIAISQISNDRSRLNRTDDRRRCHICSSTEHLMRACPRYDPNHRPERRLQGRKPGNGAGRPRPRGNRGGNNGARNRNHPYQTQAQEHKTGNFLNMVEKAEKESQWGNGQGRMGQ